MKYIVFAVFLSGLFHAAMGQKLYIFIPTEYKSIDVERNFRKNYTNLSVRSFGNVRDFKKAVCVDTPDAIITKPQLVPFLNIYTVRLNATYKGNTKESFFILSVDNKIMSDNLDDKDIGILDFLGRNHLGTFTTHLFAGSPRLKRVKKIVDLVPLVTMNMVDGLVVSASQVVYIKDRSNISFHKIKCRSDQGIAVLALFNDNNGIVNMVKEFPIELALMIGVDGWK